MKLRAALVALPLTLAIATLTACSQPAPAHAPAGAQTDAGDGHGAVHGAEEMAEPPLALVSIDSGGKAGLLDLLTEKSEQLDAQSTPLALASDGRYGFVTTASGVEVFDSGRWTWDHVDHFHYYQAAARQLGTVPGQGEAMISTGMLSTAGGTGIYFAGSGEAVLLDNAALAEGRLAESFRINVGSTGAIVAPLGGGAIVSHGNQLIWHSADGSQSERSIACTKPSGSITTRVALVIACAEGAVLASSASTASGTSETGPAASGAEVTLEMLPYPAGVETPRAIEFAARKGRPTVAALAGDTGFWLLNTREQSWSFVASEYPLARVAAVDDTEGHVLALDTDGRVLVYLASTGELVGATDPLLTEVSPNISLSLDDQRAYLNDPNTGSVYEIAYTGEPRVARTLETPSAPFWLMEVGR